MSKLQQLLDEKWPLADDDTPTARTVKLINREAFTEGYNAAMDEIKSHREMSDEKRAILERDYNPDWDHSDFHTIQ
jgi:hypothetical protein